MMPVLDAFSAEHPNFKMRSLDVDQAVQIAGEYAVVSIPTMILFQDGKEVKRLNGAMSKSALEQELQQYV
jgi:thioredoxin 1